MSDKTGWSQCDQCGTSYTGWSSCPKCVPEAKSAFDKAKEKWAAELLVIVSALRDKSPYDEASIEELTGWQQACDQIIEHLQGDVDQTDLYQVLSAQSRGYREISMLYLTGKAHEMKKSQLYGAIQKLLHDAAENGA